MKLRQSDDLSDRVLAMMRNAPKKSHRLLAEIQEQFSEAHPIKVCLGLILKVSSMSVSLRKAVLFSTTSLEVHGGQRS